MCGGVGGQAEHHPKNLPHHSCRFVKGHLPRRGVRKPSTTRTDLERDHRPENAGEEDRPPANRLAGKDIC